MAEVALSFASESYLHAKSVWRGVPQRRRRVQAADDDPGAQPFSGGRDPRVLGNILEAAAKQMGWSADLEQARIFTDWPAFVGERTASHTELIGVKEGVLQVQCDSTAWATELRRLRAELLTRMMNEYPESSIRDIRFLAPGAPTWRHGPRTVQGRGPRDTYG